MITAVRPQISFPSALHYLRNAAWEHLLPHGSMWPLIYQSQVPDVKSIGNRKSLPSFQNMHLICVGRKERGRTTIYSYRVQYFLLLNSKVAAFGEWVNVTHCKGLPLSQAWSVRKTGTDHGYDGFKHLQGSWLEESGLWNAICLPYTCMYVCVYMHTHVCMPLTSQEFFL